MSFDNTKQDTRNINTNKKNNIISTLTPEGNSKYLEYLTISNYEYIDYKDFINNEDVRVLDKTNDKFYKEVSYKDIILEIDISLDWSKYDIAFGGIYTISIIYSEVTLSLEKVNITIFSESSTKNKLSLDFITIKLGNTEINEIYLSINIPEPVGSYITTTIKEKAFKVLI